MRKILLIATVLASLPVLAGQFGVESKWHFFAPHVADEQDFNSILESGDIVYDATENKYYGKTDTSWVEFGGASPSNMVTTPSASAPVIYSARITSSGTINIENGSWVSSVTKTTTGKYQLNLETNAFTSTPVCTCTTTDNGNGDHTCGAGSFGSWDSNTIIFNTSSPDGTLDDDDFFVICHGV